jgi:hypothetical protein
MVLVPVPIPFNGNRQRKFFGQGHMIYIKSNFNLTDHDYFFLKKLHFLSSNFHLNSSKIDMIQRFSLFL